MSFQWPQLLWLLLLIPLLVGIYILSQRRRRRYAARYASLIVVNDALGRGPGFRRHIPAILFVVGLAVGIFALARPQATVLLPSSRGTVILALDMSGSMRARDVQPSRFEAAKAAARAFIAKQPRNVRIGIVAFSASAALVQAPTTSHEDLTTAMDRLRLQRGTAIGSAILVSLDAIFEDAKSAQDAAGDQPAAQDQQLLPGGPQQAQRGAPRQDPNQPLGSTPDPSEPVPVAPGSYTAAAILLLTDGQNNTGPDPLDAAEQAANRGVRVFTVGVGTTRGDVVGAEGRFFRVQLDEPSLKKIAQNTAAGYYRADNEADLVRIYEALSVRLTMGRSQTEVTALFTGIAMAVLLLGASLSLAWFRRMV
jgi:Ca-activated chloride channel homolog